MHGAWDDKNNKTWANYKFEINAPANSQESSDDCDLYGSENDEAVVDPSDKKKVDPYAKLRSIDPTIFKLSNFDLSVMKDYPFKVRDGDVPIKVCKVKRTDFFEKVSKKIADWRGAE